MLLPIVKDGTLSAGTTSLALWVYDLLAGVKKNERRKMLDRRTTLGLEPHLAQDKVMGGGLYFEYRTDDSRLVIELLKSAVANGAVCINYAQAATLLYNSTHRICGATIQDTLTHTTFDIRAKRVVNAGGPFVDLLRKTDQSLYGKRLMLTKGVHIVVPYTRLPIRYAVYFDVADGRMIFAIPRSGITYIGTTDTVYTDTIDNPRPTVADVNYLLTATNAMFPKVKLAIEDVQSSWAGLRPLIYQDGKSPSELSRKDEIIESPSGLLSIAGGKLTGYRLMAKKITDLVAKELHTPERQFQGCTTHDFRLSGGEFNTDEELQQFVAHITNSYEYALILPQHRQGWVYRYGRNTTEVLSIALTLRAKYTDTEQLALAAEMQYCYENEMCTTELDFAIRRTGMLYFDKVRLDTHADFIHDYFSTLLGRTNEERATSSLAFQEEIKAVTQF
jgi:glycerol-3-phosphate dehydrogenase